MKFDDLDKKMRVYETTHDHCVLPGMYMVARLDGRGFTKVTKEKHNFEKPFDPDFRDYMQQTTLHLMNCGFHIIYGYTESDEISLLFHHEESTFSRKTRKLNSVLAGEASAKFSLLLQDMACFDCRISELPSVNLVIDYFRWRNEDAHRNALHAHCYWKLRKLGSSGRTATRKLEGLSVSAKNEFLFENGINFNDLPSWQKRGTGFYWEEYTKTALNSKTQEEVQAKRRRIKTDMELPMKEAYNKFLEDILIQTS